MKHFFHIGPPFAFFSGWYRSLARFAERPPFLGCGVGSHPGHIGFEIIAGIFEVTEQVVFALFQLAEVNRIVVDITIFSLFHFMVELCKIEVRHILFKKICFFILLNNQIAGCCTMIYCLKRKNKKTIFSFQSMPNLDFAEDLWFHTKNHIQHNHCYE